MSKREGEGCLRRKTGQEGDQSADLSSPVLAAFRVFQRELDTKHDKHERLVKISRDVTIDSKRTIFLLHRVTSVPNPDDILAESDVKLDGVRQKIGLIAEELRGEDIFQFHRAYTPGIQEYVEAASFQHFIRHRSLITLEEINARLIFTKEEKADPTKEEKADPTKEKKVDPTKEEKADPTKEEKADPTGSPSEDVPLEAPPPPAPLTFHVGPADYLLGVADLTGELMRMCISSVGNGDMDTPFQVSQFLRQIHDGFSYIGNTGPYEVSKKLHTLRQSLGKVEDACYALRVRGSEIPKHMLADVFCCSRGGEGSGGALMDRDEGVA